MGFKRMLGVSEKHFIREKIIQGSRNYNKYLKGKSFLVVTEEIEFYIITFPAKKYRHLTGVTTSLKEEEFFTNCLSGKIAISQISNEQKYNFKTLKKKALAIEKIHKIIYSDTTNSLFLKELHTNTSLFPVGIINDNLDICIGFKGKKLQIATLRTSNNSKDANEKKRILCIFAKGVNDELYNEIVYISNIKSVFSQKEELFNYLSSEIKDKISYIL